MLAPLNARYIQLGRSLFNRGQKIRQIIRL
jgi:hypothetical protein